MQIQFLQNNFWLSYLVAVIVFCLTYLFVLFSKNLLFNYINTAAQNSSKPSYEKLLSIIKTTNKGFIVAFALFITTLIANLPSDEEFLLLVIAKILFFIQVGIWLTSVAYNILQRKLRQDNTTILNSSAGSVLSFLIHLVVWSILSLLMLQSIGLDVTTLVAGLGVGSIAIALAVQNILGDVFCSISILLDKPFQVGDFITVDTMTGTVERIGIKSTSIRSLQGEEIIISNAQLIAGRIQNFKRMSERRIVFTLNLTYQTSASAMEEIPLIIRAIIENTPDVRFDRCHFKTFGDSSLQVETAFFVLGNEISRFLNAQQSINIRIMKEFAAKQIEFAHPTQTVIVKRKAAA